MKSNHVILLATFIINIFVALSLNSFSTSDMYIPALFLYFAPNLIAFIEKVMFYGENKYRLELIISWLCTASCIIVLSVLIADSLDFIEIVFPCDCGKYRILIQGIPNSFFTFNSVDVTWFLWLSIAASPLAYLLYFLIDMLRYHGFNYATIKNIIGRHRGIFTFLPIVFMIIGTIAGFICCRHNYNLSDKIYGKPQYWKYMGLFGLLFFGTTHIVLLVRYKKKNKTPTESTSDNTAAEI